MKECPTPASKWDCAVIAAQDLVDNEQVVVDYTAKQIGRAGLYIERKAVGALEVFTPKLIHAEGMVDIADLECVACGKCVQIVDEYGDVSVRLAE